MSKESLEKLLSLAPPPKELIFRENERDNNAIESLIGTRLPTDFLEYVRYYRQCLWYEHIYFYDPYRTDEYSLWNSHKKNRVENLISLVEWCRSDPDSKFDHVVYPEKGGLLLCGGDVFGGEIAWITKGEPDEWPLVYFDYAAVYYNEYNMDITTFLVNLIEGKIKPLNFPSDMDLSDHIVQHDVRA